jgi:succinate dehydrogenase assembly factor 2
MTIWQKLETPKIDSLLVNLNISDSKLRYTRMNPFRLLPTLRAFRPLPSFRAITSTSRTLVAPDPWPLPLSPDTVSREQYAPQRLSDDPESWDMPQPLDRKGEDEETMRARLVYQTRKRGCLEGDLLLSTFAKERLGGMSIEQMREFDKVSYYNTLQVTMGF